MKMIQTSYSVYTGLAPVKFRGRVYNTLTANFLFAKGNMEVFQKKNGEYFIHVLLPAIGHFIAVNVDEINVKLLEQTRM